MFEREYNLPETKTKLWESIFMERPYVLKMWIRKCSPDAIYGFDTLDELENLIIHM